MGVVQQFVGEKYAAASVVEDHLIEKDVCNQRSQSSRNRRWAMAGTDCPNVVGAFSGRNGGLSTGAVDQPGVNRWWVIRGLLSCVCLPSFVSENVKITHSVSSF